MYILKKHNKMAPELPIDLKPYGMNWFFDPINKIIVPKDYLSRLNKFTIAKKEDGNLVIESNVEGHLYTTKGILGKGTYGTVYLADRSDGKEITLKLIEPGVPIPGNIKESIVQLIVYELTKGLRHEEIGLFGPYAPALYEIGFSENTRQLFIVSEKMRATTNSMLKTRESRPDMLRIDVPNMLIQIATILEDLYVLCNFNHRDLKSDNCMYIRDEAGNMQIRLIDFGMSCLKYGKREITGSTIEFVHCSLKTRDMTQLLFELHRFHKYFPDDLKRVLEGLLTFKRDGVLCKMYEDCAKQTKWTNTYSYLNSDEPNPNCSPLVVINVMTAYKNKEDWKVHLDYVPGKEVVKNTLKIKVPKGRLLNPNTGRLVKADGKKGKELLVSSKKNKSKAKSIGLKPCPTSQPIFNPFTRRCVSKCSPGHKRTSTFKCVKI
jgi:hypothetical protein